MNMNGCLNILWHFPFFGFLFAFFYALFGAILCCTVVLYPVGLGFFQIARFLLTPFSSALVTRKELDLVRPEERSTAAAAFSTVITILYFPFGLIAAAGALFAMIGEFLSIIGIPCGIVWFKALTAIFMPVDRICVPKAVADEIARIKAGDTVRRYKGETGEPEPHSAERHFTEDPGETLPPMPEVRQYDDEKLHEIVSGAAMYRASLVEECRRELEAEQVPLARDIEVGMMVEVPSAAILADQFAQEVDFFSIGTNDLTQYTLAADRLNDKVADLFDSSHPAVLRLIQNTAQAAAARGIWCGICGESAGNEALLPFYIKAGVRELSVVPGKVLELRRALSAIDASTL